MDRWHSGMHRRYHFIQFPVVHSHPPRAIRLPYKPHRELNGLCAGCIMSTFASSAMVVPISLWPPDRQYCLTATALQGFSNTYGGCFAYPLMTAFTTRTWRWNSPTDIRNTRPFKTSTPKIYSGNGDMYTVYTCTESHPISNGKDTAFTSMFWPP